jgi:hypothetical protein
MTAEISNSVPVVKKIPNFHRTCFFKVKRRLKETEHKSSEEYFETKRAWGRKRERKSENENAQNLHTARRSEG